MKCVLQPTGIRLGLYSIFFLWYFVYLTVLDVHCFCFNIHGLCSLISSGLALILGKTESFRSLFLNFFGTEDSFTFQPFWFCGPLPLVPFLVPWTPAHPPLPAFLILWAPSPLIISDTLDPRTPSPPRLFDTADPLLSQPFWYCGTPPLSHFLVPWTPPLSALLVPRTHFPKLSHKCSLNLIQCN
jgi:hypothetical protein